MFCFVLFCFFLSSPCHCHIFLFSKISFFTVCGVNWKSVSRSIGRQFVFISIIVVQKQVVTLSTRVAKLIEIEGFKRYLEDRVNNLMDESDSRVSRQKGGSPLRCSQTRVESLPAAATGPGKLSAHWVRCRKFFGSGACLRKANLGEGSCPLFWKGLFGELPW